MDDGTDGQTARGQTNDDGGTDDATDGRTEDDADDEADKTKQLALRTPRYISI